MALFRFGKSASESSSEGEQPVAAKPGVFDRLRAGLSKTAQVLNTDVRDLLKQEGRHVDTPFLEELRGALVRTDMGPSAAEAIVKDVEEIDGHQFCSRELPADRQFPSFSGPFSLEACWLSGSLDFERV